MDSSLVVLWFCFHSYDYRQNRTPLSPITIMNAQLKLETGSICVTYDGLIGSHKGRSKTFLLCGGGEGIGKTLIQGKVDPLLKS